MRSTLRARSCTTGRRSSACSRRVCRTAVKHGLQVFHFEPVPRVDAFRRLYARCDVVLPVTHGEGIPWSATGSVQSNFTGVAGTDPSTRSLVGTDAGAAPLRQ